MRYVLPLLVICAGPEETLINIAGGAFDLLLELRYFECNTDTAIVIVNVTEKAKIDSLYSNIVNCNHCSYPGACQEDHV